MVVQCLRDLYPWFYEMWCRIRFLFKWILVKIKTVFKRCKKKYQLLCKRGNFSGYVIADSSITPSEKKVKSVRDYLIPINKKVNQSMLYLPSAKSILYRITDEIFIVYADTNIFDYGALVELKREVLTIHNIIQFMSLRVGDVVDCRYPIPNSNPNLAG